MRKERKHYSSEEKVAILRRHLLDKVPVADHELLWLDLSSQVVGRQATACSHFETAQCLAPECTNRGAKLAPRWNPQLAALHAREFERGHRNRATLAVVRKLAAYLLAVDRSGHCFQSRSLPVIQP